MAKNVISESRLCWYLLWRNCHGGQDTWCPNGRLCWNNRGSREASLQRLPSFQESQNRHLRKLTLTISTANDPFAAELLGTGKTYTIGKPSRS